MPMTTDEARELRAALSESLDPLYAARAGTIPALAGVQAAIVQLHKIDMALLGVIRRAEIPGVPVVVDASMPVDEARFVTLTGQGPPIAGTIVGIGDAAKE